VQEIRIAYLGFGNVGRALDDLFAQKRDELRDNPGFEIKVTGVATGGHGMAVDAKGLNMQALRKAKDISAYSSMHLIDVFDFIRNCQANVIFENTPVNYQTGQPAISHIKAALDRGMHAITANKGPVVHAYRELSELADRNGCRFLFESTVMDGAPIFSLFREALPGANLKSFSGVLNSTTNMILTRMEAGDGFEEAVSYCQEIGIAETDPSGDIDGWDASVKIAALATVLMDIPLKPIEVQRKGIREISKSDVKKAQQNGKRWKLVCSARRVENGVEAKVSPSLVGPESPLFGVMGTSSIIQFETDVLGVLSVIESDPGPRTTAYGLYADFLNANR
jgi:homoserine dehydrogenase